MGTLAISFVSSFVSVLFWREKSRGLLIPESSMVWVPMLMHAINATNRTELPTAFALICPQNIMEEIVKDGIISIFT